MSAGLLEKIAVNDHGFSYMLLVFYNQVLGLPQYLVGTCIFIGLVCQLLMLVELAPP